MRLTRPGTLAADAAPASLELTLVEARECDPPLGAAPLIWRLLSRKDLPPEQVVRLYRLRWRVEQLFRTLKSDGLKLDETQLLDAPRLFKLASIGLGAAARIIQLVDARDGGDRPASDVLDPVFEPALAAISASLEGRTARQKNPASAGIAGLSGLGLRAPGRLELLL